MAIRVTSRRALLAALCEFAGAVCLAFGFQITAQPGIRFTVAGTDAPARRMATVASDRPWLVNLGWTLLATGFVLDAVGAIKRD